MAPTAVNVERQTSLVIKYLFEDEHDVSLRQIDDGLETDGPVGEDDGFDPVLVADKLKRIADALNEDAKFKAALTDLKQAAAQEAMEAAFSQGVDLVCETQLASTADLAPEMQLIKASVAIGLYVKKSAPELKSKIQSVMASYINRRVGPWIAEQGGWDRVTGVSV